jgi:hypothetical protein
MESLFLRHPWLLLTGLSVVSVAVVSVVAIVASAWRSIRKTDLEVALKQDMLNRGLSAADIERVLQASSTPSPPERPAWEKGDPISDNEYYLVEKLVEEGKSAEEIAHILQAIKSTHQSEAAPRDVAIRVG